MPIHDAWARRTPYELFLPEPDSAEERFAAVRAEAAERGSDLSDPEQFGLLMSVGEALRELKGPSDDPQRIRQHALLLFHAYHFREAGEPLWLLSAPAARYVVETAAGPASGGEPPSPAGYLQLPQHLFWGRTEAEAGDEPGSGDAVSPPESLDGVFWSAGGGRVSVLGVLGVRPDRPGFSVVALPPLPLADAPGWAATDMREGGDDFRSDMPGAELESLYEVRTAGEVLKLLSRSWAMMEPDALERGEPPDEVDPSGPPPTTLPSYRLEL